MAVPAAPKGTRDFYPPEMRFREHLFRTWERTSQRYGFEPYDGPLFEHLDLYTQKSGQEIEKQLYSFEDKGGRMVSLRPELTPTLARMVAAKGTALKRPVRWFSIPRLFRYEKMQRGRLREFFQLNLDILGISDVSADGELIAASVDMMRDLGFDNNDFSVRVSSRLGLEQAFKGLGVPQESLAALYGLLDKKHKISPEAFEEELAGIIPDKGVQKKIGEVFEARTIGAVRDIGVDIPSLTDLEHLFELLAFYGMEDYITFDIGIVRGLAYYTGIVFELFDKKRSLRAIAGGGRYDHLVQAYGGPPTPAVGFAAGDVVIGEMLKEKELPPTPGRADAFVICFPESYPELAIKTAQSIRTGGISCEFALKQTGIGKQMKLAHASGASVAVFVGGEEESQGKVKVKEMATGLEHLIGRENLATQLETILT